MSAAVKSKKRSTKRKRKVDRIRGCDQRIKRIRIPFESAPTYAAPPSRGVAIPDKRFGLGYSEPISDHHISIQGE